MEIITNDSYNENEKNMNNIKLKIVLIRDTETGKTSFTSRLFSNNYSQFIKKNSNISSSNTAYFMNLKVKYKNKLFALDLWVTTGLLKFHSLTKIFYKDADIILIFYNSFNTSSFNRLNDFINEIKYNVINNPLIVMIRNKYEVNSNKYDNMDFISDEEALEYADSNQLLFCHLSNYEKYETGINQLFETLLNEYLKNNHY